MKQIEIDFNWTDTETALFEQWRRIAFHYDVHPGNFAGGRGVWNGSEDQREIAEKAFSAIFNDSIDRYGLFLVSADIDNDGREDTIAYTGGPPGVNSPRPELMVAPVVMATLEPLKIDVERSVRVFGRQPHQFERRTEQRSPEPGDRRERHASGPFLDAYEGSWRAQIVSRAGINYFFLVFVEDKETVEHVFLTRGSQTTDICKS